MLLHISYNPSILRTRCHSHAGLHILMLSTVILYIIAVLCKYSPSLLASEHVYDFVLLNFRPRSIFREYYYCYDEVTCIIISCSVQSACANLASMQIIIIISIFA